MGYLRGCASLSKKRFIVMCMTPMQIMKMATSSPTVSFFSTNKYKSRNKTVYKILPLRLVI